MSEHGLRIVSDPRWIVALPGQDIVAEVARQLGQSEWSGATERSAIVESITGVLSGAIDGGAWWSAVMVLEEGGRVVVMRSAIEWSGVADQPISANDIFDLLIVESRDAEYNAQLDLVSLQLGTAVRHQQVLLFADGSLGDYLGFSVPYAGGILAVRTFCTATGWVEFFAPMVEAMVLSLSPDAQNAFGEVTLLAYVVAAGDL